AGICQTILDQGPAIGMRVGNPGQRALPATSFWTRSVIVADGAIALTRTLCAHRRQRANGRLRRSCLRRGVATDGMRNPLRGIIVTRREMLTPDGMTTDMLPSSRSKHD